MAKIDFLRFDIHINLMRLYVFMYGCKYTALQLEETAICLYLLKHVQS